MKNKIQSLSVFLFLAGALFLIGQILMIGINFFSSLDVPSSAIAFGG